MSSVSNQISASGFASNCCCAWCGALDAGGWSHFSTQDLQRILLAAPGAQDGGPYD